METFLDNLDLNTVNQTSNRNHTTLIFRTFALQIEEIDTDAFRSQTFTVALGPVEQARNGSKSFDQSALITEDGEADSEMNKGEVTASVQLPSSLFRDCIDSETNTSSPTSSRQRLSYSVFLTDALFLPMNRTLNKVGSIVVAARTSCHLDNKSVVTVPIQSSFQIIKTVS